MVCALLNIPVFQYSNIPTFRSIFSILRTNDEGILACDLTHYRLSPYPQDLDESNPPP